MTHLTKEKGLCKCWHKEDVHTYNYLLKEILDCNYKDCPCKKFEVEELAGVNHSLQGSASEIEEKGMPVNTRKGLDYPSISREFGQEERVYGNYELKFGVSIGTEELKIKRAIHLALQEGRQSKLKDELEFLKRLMSNEFTEGIIDGKESPEIKIVLERIKQISKELAGVEE